MATQYEVELFSSLKKLFETGDFSDLKITCGEDQHKVHAAIVCPRSELFGKLYAEIEEDSDAVINILDEDPLAVKLMLHYLYTLDYPQVDVPGGQDAAVVVNGFHHADEVKQSPPPVSSLEYSIEKEQFVDNSSQTANDASSTATAETTASARTKKSRKKKRASVSVPPTDRTGMSASDATAVAPQVSSNLVVHAKVYSLGSKFGVGGLKALSAEKFLREVEQHWDSDDFLGAAHEAYTSTDEQDRTIRDVVLNTLNQHPELLQRKQVQDAIRGLQLSFDLLMLRLGESDAGSPTVKTAPTVTASGLASIAA